MSAMEIPNEKMLNCLLIPGDMKFENIPVDQAVAWLIGLCAQADIPLRLCKIEGGETTVRFLDTKHRTVKECLDILAELSGCVRSINPNGLFYFVRPQSTARSALL